MITYESECVGCGKPCIKDACPHYKVRKLYCDECGQQVRQLYVVDDKQMCKSCAADWLLEDWEHIIS